MSLFLIVTTLMIGGYAVDVSNVMTARTKLQVTADAVAHAALLTRELKTEAEAKSAALALAQTNMPSAAFGTVMTASDIVFGDWNATTRSFTARSGSKNAVQVQTTRSESGNNPVHTYLLKLVGLDDWNLVTSAVFVSYYPTCLREGFVAEQPVDLQSNNSYSNGFCIHSNSYVSLNSNNYFEPGTVVSMPNLDDIELPNSGYKTNVGLSDALREGSWNIRIIKRIDDIIAGLKTFHSLYLPSYITSFTVKTLTNRNVYAADLIQGKVHTLNCGSGGAALTIKNGVTMRNVVLVTDCKVKFESGVILENSVVATTNESSMSITAASGVQIGKDDHCAPGGGAQLVTMGSMNFPSSLKMFGGQLLAVHDIDFAANANGIEGAAMVAGGVISGTSNMAMAFCGSGMDANFEAQYFKLVL